MKSAILEKQKICYTDMKLVFNAINNVQTKYNWLISSYECNHYPSDKIKFNNEYVWISGEELTDIVNKNDIQFIWGNFIAFEKGLALNQIIKEGIPKIDDAFTDKSDLKVQHPLGIIQIVACDSSYVFIISKEEKYVDDFLNFFPLAEDCARYKGRYE
jgi:hypothetical protein